MINTATIKEFLKFEKKKLILPVILILPFFVLVNSFYTLSSVQDEYLCESTYLNEELIIYYNQNNTLAYNQTVEKLDNIRENMAEFEKSNIYLRDKKIIERLFFPMNKINPLFPVPCEWGISPVYGRQTCVYYLNEKSYNCLKEFLSFLNQNEDPYTSTYTSILSTSLPDYKQISAFILTLNILVLFVEGYLISCLILFIHRTIKNKIIKI